jgi:hypothetical protein
MLDPVPDSMNPDLKHRREAKCAKTKGIEVTGQGYMKDQSQKQYL